MLVLISDDSKMHWEVLQMQQAWKLTLFLIVLCCTPTPAKAEFVYAAVTDMPGLMRATDLLVCKSGGLTIAEAAALGVPLLILDPIPGQEQRNADVLLEAGAAPGPDEPNIYQIAPPCTTHCAWNLKNGGTRTFVNPDGDPSCQADVDGNILSDFSAQLADRLHENDREWMIEHPAPDGRYPKIWDRPRYQALKKRTGAQVIALAQCEWGLGPPDEPEKRYQKNTFWLVSRGLYPRALALARRSSGDARAKYIYADLKKFLVHYVVTELKSRSEETTNTKEMGLCIFLRMRKLLQVFLFSLLYPDSRFDCQ